MASAARDGCMNNKRKLPDGPIPTDQHPLGKERFEALLDVMSRGKKPPAAGTSSAGSSSGYAGKKTRRGSSEDTSG